MTTQAASVGDRDGDRQADNRDAERRARELHERQRAYVLASLLATPDEGGEQRPGT